MRVGIEGLGQDEVMKKEKKRTWSL